jgi:hypothetical protein
VFCAISICFAHKQGSGTLFPVEPAEMPLGNAMCGTKPVGNAMLRHLQGSAEYAMNVLLDKAEMFEGMHLSKLPAEKALHNR